MCIAKDAAAGHAILPAPRRRGFCTPGATAPARRSAGFTLLEVLVAAALGTVVLMALVTAIDIHFRVYDTSRANVEEAQLARALLGRIAADLRGAIQYDPIQAEKLMSSTSSQSGSSSGSTGSSSSADSTASADAADPTASADAQLAEELLGTEETDASRTSNLASSSVPPTVPGLYGNQYEMQVDVSRLPRIDQLEAMLLQAADDASPYDRPSDVKTVTYYVNSPNSVSMMGMTDSMLAGMGLIRRELDRAVTAFASQQGNSSAFDMNLPPLAPEVNLIQFSYFDGTDWYSEWDSVTQGKLPTAVQVTIAITPARRNKAGPLSWLDSSAALDSEPDPAHMYCLLVQLPGAQPPRTYGSSGSSDQTEEEMTDEAMQESSQDMTGAAPAAPAPTSSPSSPAPSGGSSGPGGAPKR